MWWVAGAIVGLWLIVYLLPDVLFHHLQWGAFAGSREKPEVALSFDDGPGPDTGAVLDELLRLNARATFFVVSERAQAHPDIIRRMIAEGHEVGLHMREHVSAFFLTPGQSYRRIKAGLDQLQTLLGHRPTLFRPPWGHVNLGIWVATLRFGLTPVFWNIAPDDWREDRTAEAISAYVVQLAQPGTVVVLHDAGGPRQRTVDSLQDMVQGLNALGLRPVVVGSMQRDRSTLRRIWTWWELRFTRGWNIQTIPNSTGGEPFLRVGRINYRGPRVALSGSRILKPGDRVAEIHFSNPALAQFSGQAASGRKALHSFVAALSDTAQWIQQQPEYASVAAVGGVTLLDASRTVEKLGFRHVPVRGWTKWSMWIYLMVLMSIYHQEGWRTLRRFRHLKPVMLLMDIDILMTRYERPRKLLNPEPHTP